MSLDNNEAQNDELLAISSIYEDCFFQAPTGSNGNGSDLLGGELRLHIKLPKPFTIIRKCIASTVDETLNVEYLPPLVLNFYFPPTYPSSHEPNFTLSCKWLSNYQLSKLCKELDKLWEADKENVIMFTWAQFLSDEVMSFLKLDNILELPNCSNTLRMNHYESNSENRREACSELQDDPPSEYNILAANETRRNYQSEYNGHESDSEATFVCESEVSNTYKSEPLDARGIQDFSPDLNLVSFLREYNEEEKTKKFNSTKYECLICYSEKSGLHCMEFYPCCHVFCNTCCKTFFEVQITSGNIKLLKCPTDKCLSDASPKQVESLVCTELYERWDKMLLNSTLSSMDDIQLCPRMHCQYPVTIEEMMGRCPACSFVFCSLCRFGYHGVEKCRFKKEEVRELVNTYENGTYEEKQKLIRKYGRKQLNYLAQEYLSAEYISDSFQKCPQCRTNIEKIDGCNKMSCNRCNTNFCWLCSEVIPTSNPYLHFSVKGTPCYDQLFRGVVGEEDEWFDLEEGWVNEEGNDDYIFE